MRNSEAGVGLMEILVAIILLSVVALGMTLNLSTSLRIGKITEAHFAASTLASGHLEELSAVDTANLDASYNEVDTVVTFPNLAFDFYRTTTVVINADNSRTVSVSVNSGNAALPTTVTFSTTLALWE